MLEVSVTFLGVHIAQLWKFFWMADEEVSKNVSLA